MEQVRDTDAMRGAEVSDSRRRVLARIGVGAAAVWSAPLVTSLGSSAAAAASDPGETTTTTTTTTTEPPPPPQPVLDFSQTSRSGIRSLDNDSGTSNQIWQPFVAGRSGSLVHLAVWTRIQAAGAGPLDVSVHAADPVTGAPAGPAIGSGSLPEPTPEPAPAPGTAKTVTLSTPAPLTADSTYVLVFTKPAASATPWQLFFGSVSGFPYTVKLWYSPTPVAGPGTLYLQTYVL